MATYAIGDIQGCMEPLERLLRTFDFSPRRDRLWLTGDLVNRGPRSLDVLRFAKQNESVVTTVLGNHDLHLLAVDARVRHEKEGDTFADILRAPDRRELLDWLARRPLLVREDDYVLVHAGLHPSWSVDDAMELAEEVSRRLQNDALGTLRSLYEAKPQRSFTPGMKNGDRLRTAVAALTRMRMCTNAGEMDLQFSGPPSEAPPGLVPWFFVPGRKARETTHVFGHWAALGLKNEAKLIALDTGCVWGQALSAVRLEDRRVFSVPARCEAPAGG